jgi:hypothetical protein
MQSKKEDSVFKMDAGKSILKALLAIIKKQTIKYYMVI